MTRLPAILGGTPAFAENLYVTRPVVPAFDELCPVIEDLLQSKILTNNGPYVRQLEEDLKNFLQVKHCPVFCNGTLALQLAVRGLGLSGEVITTPFTFPATPHVLRWNNLDIVFSDIDSDSYNIDPDRLAALITPRTTAILPVHVFGNPCAVECIQKIAEKNGLYVLYDAAHAFGVQYARRSIAQYGDATMFSFHATKSFNTMEGGAVACSDPDLAKKLQDMRNFGIIDENRVGDLGINAKMNELQAAFGIIVLSKVAASIEHRRLLFERYTSQLKEIPGIRLQHIRPVTRLNYHYMTVQVDENVYPLKRDVVYASLRAERIMARRYFWPLCSDYPCYRELPSAAPSLLPNAQCLSRQVLSLPLHVDMTPLDVDRVVEILAQLPQHTDAIKKATRLIVFAMRDLTEDC